jgi:hypothetical protein
MTTRPVPRCLLAPMLLALLLAPLATVAAAPASVAQAELAAPLIYRQLIIPPVAPEHDRVESPVLSANGTWAVFEDSGPDTLESSRIYVVDVDGGGEPVLVDESPWLSDWVLGKPRLDISADGTTVLSPEAAQLRVAGLGQSPRALLVMDGEPISDARLTGDGQTVVFTLRHPATTRGGTMELPPGLWAVSTGGGEPRQIASEPQVAAALGVDERALLAVFAFSPFWHALDVANDGSRVAFAGSVGGKMHVFSIAGDGGLPQVLAGPFDVVSDVAISGDGRTVAYAGWDYGAEDGGLDYALGVVRPGEGQPRRFDQPVEGPLQVSADGTRLLLSHGTLIDVATATARPLRDPLLARTRQWTMNADATRFLYLAERELAGREELGLLTIGPADQGAAPVITDARLASEEIPLGGAAAAGATAQVSWEGTLLGVWLVTIRAGNWDRNVPGDGYGLVQLHDTAGDDPARGEGHFATDQIRHLAHEERPDDAGPRTARLIAAVEAADGRRHATALDVGPLTVVPAP